MILRTTANLGVWSQARSQLPVKLENEKIIRRHVRYSLSAFFKKTGTTSTKRSGGVLL